MMRFLKRKKDFRGFKTNLWRSNSFDKDSSRVDGQDVVLKRICIHMITTSVNFSNIDLCQRSRRNYVKSHNHVRIVWISVKLIYPVKSLSLSRICNSLSESGTEIFQICQEYSTMTDVSTSDMKALSFLCYLLSYIVWWCNWWYLRPDPSSISWRRKKALHLFQDTDDIFSPWQYDISS